jgi:hypothetical protein
MTKKRTMNELRQTKDTHYVNPTFKTNIASDEGKKYLDIAGDNFMLKQAKDQIVNELQDRFYDVIFQAVCDKMEKHEAFKAETYFTPQGLDEFEDIWFEFYHEHHGDILYRVLQKLEP